MLRKIINLAVKKSRLNRLILLLYYVVRKVIYNSADLPEYEDAVNFLDDFRHDPKSCCYRDNANQDGIAQYNLDIIVPCYNVEKYIEQCLDSMISQKTSYSYRVICIDDGSTDRTADILDRYAETNSNIVVVHNENKGAAGARNTGIDMIESEYVMFVDSDDYIAEDAIENMMNAAYENSAALVQGGYVRVTEKGKIIKRNRQKKGKLNIQELTGFPCFKVIKSNYVKSAYFPLGYFFEDSVMSMIIFDLIEKNNGIFYGIDKTIYYYRYKPKFINYSELASNKAIDTLYITRQLHKDRSLYGLKISRRYYEFILSTIRLSYSRTYMLSKEINKSIFVMFKRFIEQEFREFLYDNNKKTALEKAFLENDYRLYVLSCNFEQ